MYVCCACGLKLSKQDTFSSRAVFPFQTKIWKKYTKLMVAWLHHVWFLRIQIYSKTKENLYISWNRREKSKYLSSYVYFWYIKIGPAETECVASSWGYITFVYKNAKKHKFDNDPTALVFILGNSQIHQNKETLCTFWNMCDKSTYLSSLVCLWHDKIGPAKTEENRVFRHFVNFYIVIIDKWHNIKINCKLWHTPAVINWKYNKDL